jgi:hypothetical protein
MQNATKWAAMCLLLAAGWAWATPTVAWTDDFSTNPSSNGWTSVTGSGGEVVWDAGRQAIKIHNTSGSVASMSRSVGTVLNGASEFAAQTDWQMDYCWFYARATAGFTSSTGSSRILLISEPRWNDSGDPTQMNMWIAYTMADGSGYSGWQNPIVVGQYTTNAVTLGYDPLTRTISLSAAGATVSTVVPSDKDFSVDRFTYGCDNGNGDDYFYADNLSVSVPEPMTLALLAMGGVAMLRKRM